MNIKNLTIRVSYWAYLTKYDMIKKNLLPLALVNPNNRKNYTAQEILEKSATQ